jgi:hypothetical protein
VLEANDFQHSNVFVNFAAVKRLVSERTDHPDLISSEAASAPASARSEIRASPRPEA